MKISDRMARGALVALLAVTGVSDVWAGRIYTQGSVGFMFGPPWEPWYYPPYPRYYPVYPPVIIERAPPVYIEQAPPVSAPPASYWYYCAASGGYYPYVKACPSGWQKVLPQPADVP